MSQLLVCMSEQKPPSVLGVDFEKVSGDAAYMSSVLGQTHCLEASMWLAVPPDDILQRSRESVIAGRSVEETPVGVLMHSVLGVHACAIAIFYAGFPDNLPVVSSVSDLMKLLENQLRQEHPMGIELYGILVSQ